jgi:hypothetical protein
VSIATLKVTSHVGRDLLQSAQLFRHEHSVVWEYVSNGLQYKDPATKPTAIVKVDAKAKTMSIRDNGRGMLVNDLQRYFQMHGENLDRKEGRPGRGYFGTGKAFVTAGIEPEDFIAFEFDKKAREVRVKTGGPDLFEAIQHEENSSVGDDLEGKEVDAIPADADLITNDDLTGDHKKWSPISIAPAERDLEVRLEDSFGRYVLLFPCRFLPGQGWINSRLETPLPSVPVDWRHWDESSMRL